MVILKDYKQYIGKKYNKLTILEYLGRDRYPIFKCQCDCGKIKNINLDSMKGGLTTSCGCVRTESARNRMIRSNKDRRKYQEITPGSIKGYLFVKEINIKINDAYYHLCDCIKCQKENFYVSKSDIEYGRYITCGCGLGITSKWQYEINEFITKELNIITELNNKTQINPYHIDIFIPEKFVGIECHGLRYHSYTWLENHKIDGRNYHKHKFELCLQKNIRLVSIFEDEWCRNEDLIKSKIKNILGCSNNLIKVRPEKCTIREVKFKEINDFMFNNHVQGSCSAKIHIGAFLNDTLVSVMSFDNKGDRANNKLCNGVWNLKRIATDVNYNIPGLISKMLKIFISGSWLEKYEKQLFVCKKVYTFSDLRWSTGELYTILGFKKIELLSPDYYYVKGMQRKNKSQFIVKAGINEFKEAKKAGWDRIYDCGKIKYEL